MFTLASEELTCVISAMWVNQWIKYVRDPSAPVPGHISNNLLLENSTAPTGPELKKGLAIKEDYRCITEEQWNIYASLYGGL